MNYFTTLEGVLTLLCIVVFTWRLALCPDNRSRMWYTVRVFVFAALLMTLDFIIRIM